MREPKSCQVVLTKETRLPRRLWFEQPNGNEVIWELPKTKWNAHVLPADRVQTAAKTLPPSLYLEVADIEDPVEVGHETSFEVRVTNTGSQTATALELTLEIPPGIEVKQMRAPTPSKRIGNKMIIGPLASWLREPMRSSG